MPQTDLDAHIGRLLSGVSHVDEIRISLEIILRSLPVEVIEDFLADPTFRIDLEQLGQNNRSQMFMAAPIGRDVSRCVILRPKLRRASDAFRNYVIAHELAHAFLRNGGWGQYTDREEAADALAAIWGYPRPETW
ncbi:MAG TPA: hypothetical protein DDW52_09335 [Planctomycetaceae bacterium]|nr:hypothetical protein [Planctomycetaceae bacterium]